MAKKAPAARGPSDRTVIVVQNGKRQRTYAAKVITSPHGFRYFLFDRDRSKALTMTEREALHVLDEWTAADRPARNLCTIEPA